MRTIFCRLINSCWFFFRGGAALLALAAGIGVWYYVTRFDDEIRRQVQARLAANYPQLEVTVRAAQRVAGEGIVVRGVSLVERGADGPQAELVYVDELFLACPTDVRELVSGDLPIRSITVRRPTLRATRRPDGTWSVAKLLPLPHCGRQRPQTTIENASVEVFDPQRTPAVSYTLRNVNLALHPVTEPNNAPLPSDALGANTSKSPSPSPPLVALPPPGGMTPTDSLANTRQTGEIEFEGSLAGDLMHRTEFHGRLNPQTGKVSLGGRAEQLEIGPELCSLLPASAGSAAGYLSALRGQLDLTLRLDVDPSQPVPYRFDVQGQLNHGRIDDPRLPYPVTDIVARIQVSNNGFRVDDVMARAGLTMLSLNCQGQGLSSTSPITLTADARKFMLERQLVDLLPPT
ncbi:MAG: hypothetical protein K8T25_18770, partial [Planctomycetia bacterium]|nr:hypothetical protein [Planctomycetia bacterium]